MLLCFCFILLTIQQVVLKLQKSVFYIIHQSGEQSIAGLWSLTHMLSAIHHLISCSFESSKSPIIINQTNKQTEIMKDCTPQFCTANILHLLFFLNQPIKLKMIQTMFIICFLYYNKFLSWLPYFFWWHHHPSSHLC